MSDTHEQHTDTPNATRFFWAWLETYVAEDAGDPARIAQATAKLNAVLDAVDDEDTERTHDE